MEHNCSFESKVKPHDKESFLKIIIANKRNVKIKTTFEQYFVLVNNEVDAKFLYESGGFGYKILADSILNLKLSLQEAFFLFYGLNCLEIYSNDKLLTIKECWDLFCSSELDFIKYYIVYHHFRVKGWVIKGGEKFAGDFLLYKDGPEFYHASYVVIIDFENNGKYRWDQLLPLVRVAETCKKNVIIARIIGADIISLRSFKSPIELGSISVHELLVERWTA